MKPKPDGRYLPEVPAIGDKIAAREELAEVEYARVAAVLVDALDSGRWSPVLVASLVSEAWEGWEPQTSVRMWAPSPERCDLDLWARLWRLAIALGFEAGIDETDPASFTLFRGGNSSSMSWTELPWVAAMFACAAGGSVWRAVVCRDAVVAFNSQDPYKAEVLIDPAALPLDAIEVTDPAIVGNWPAGLVRHPQVVAANGWDPEGSRVADRVIEVA
jgi:hypothetical protein